VEFHLIDTGHFALEDKADENDSADSQFPQPKGCVAMKRASATPYPERRNQMADAADFLAMTFSKGAPYYVCPSSVAAIYT
jgi:hypothetical protein